MKATKKYATSHGQSHYPSNMIHVSPEVFPVPNMENNGTMIILCLSHLSGSGPTELRVRMSPVEAEALGQKLIRVAATS